MIAAVLVFALALTLNVAFAREQRCYNQQHQQCPCPDQSNDANDIVNEFSAVSSTGNNDVAFAFGSAGIYTGDAYASVLGANAVNSNLKTGFSFGSSAQTNKAVFVKNSTTAASNTGYNTVKFTGAATVATGAAVSTVKGINLVNTNVKLGGGWN